jgi:hypothetical protein
LGSKWREINGFSVACDGPDANLVGAGSARRRSTNCRSTSLCVLHPSLSLQPESQFPTMPRYYFNTRIGDELISDPDGEELHNPDRAWEMARAMILALLKSEGTDERLLNATVEVTDDEGEIVLEFPFAEALLDTPDAPVTRH